MPAVWVFNVDIAIWYLHKNIHSEIQKHEMLGTPKTLYFSSMTSSVTTVPSSSEKKMDNSLLLVAERQTQKD